MTFIDDDGNQLEFNGDFAMTKQAVSFFNGAIKGDVSMTFSIANNSINRKVLGYYGPQMTSQVAFTKQAFNRVRNGNVIDRGYIVIQNDTEDTLQCFYVSGNSNWIQLITGLITELDYSGSNGGGKNYNVLYAAASIVTKTTATEGIIFPLVDWNSNLKRGIGQSNNSSYESFMLNDQSPIVDSSHNPKVTFYDWYPCFYLWNLVDEICIQNGLKIEGNIKNDPIYKSIIIPPVSALMKRDSFKNITAVGSSQNIAAGVTQKYTALTETSDPDNLFSNNTFTTNKQAGAKIFITFSPSSITEVGFAVYVNGINYFGSFQTVPYSGYVFEFQVIPYLPGSIIEIYVRNTGAGLNTATINLLKIETPEFISIGDYVNPSHFLPSIKCLDIIKFVINYFGCVVTFDEFSKTINCNIIEKFKVEDAEDWSSYFKNCVHNYTVDQAQNNYLRFDQDNITTGINNYNNIHKIKFGDGNIETNNNLKAEKDLLKFPFAPSEANFSSDTQMYLPNIPLINLVDNSEPIPYTVITDIGSSNARLTVIDGTIFTTNEIIRITNSAGVNMGYFIVLSFAATTVDVYSFVVSNTDTGNIWKQTINYNEIKPRILSVYPNITSTNPAFINLREVFSVVTTVQSIPICWFTKKANIKLTLGASTLDTFTNNLSIDNPDSGDFIDPTMKQLYFNKISKFLQNPSQRVIMTLPESIYQSFNFDQFIYLKTEKLTGYFFVDSINNYVDANTPVEVNLYML